MQSGPQFGRRSPCRSAQGDPAEGGPCGYGAAPPKNTGFEDLLFLAIPAVPELWWGWTMEKLTRKEGRQCTEREELDEFLDGQWWGVLSVGNAARPGRG